MEYDGSAFHGWQRQTPRHQGGKLLVPSAPRTVQAVMEEALGNIPQAVPKLRAAGRTDAGVHALAMVAHYDTHDTIPTARIPHMFNAHLPDDVRVLHAEQVPATFEAQYSCCYRRYLYRIQCARDHRAGSALARERRLFVYQQLDVAAMQRACQAFVGRHDFAALATQETRATVREVYLACLQAEGAQLYFHVVADGFLRNMVRAMVGTLVWVGTGKLTAEELPALLARKQRSQLGMNAPAHALYFVEAGYQPWDERKAATVLREAYLI